MRRVLLVIDDYNELLYVEKILKKVGFDVESLPSEASLPERMMGFLPDLVIATGEGARVNGHSVSKKVKRKGVHATLLLLFTRQKLLSIDLATYAAEGAIESPVVPRNLLKSVCEFTGIPPQGILAKYDKLPNLQNEESKMQIISNKNGGKGGSSYPDGESRSSRYQKLLQNVPEAEAKMFDHTRVEAERRFQRSQPDTADELELDEQRKDFVKKLYKTWSRK